LIIHRLLKYRDCDGKVNMEFELTDYQIELRRLLHRNPELSGHEKKTARTITEYIKKYNPDGVINNLGGEGVAFIFNGAQMGTGADKGPTVMIRCELDALPIDEINQVEYRSGERNVMHACGHDGHMTIAASLAPILNRRKPNRGRVVLLFQPAEETGRGADLVIGDRKFRKITPDYIFALHNLPGFSKGTIILSRQNFAAASRGMIIKLTGKTSHAAEPEKGNSPAMAMSRIVEMLSGLKDEKNNFKDFKLATVIHVRLGEIAFGTTPGYAEVIATLRSYRNDDMEKLANMAESRAHTIADNSNIGCEVEWTEEFPATVNHEKCTELIESAISKTGYPSQYIEKPFKWSEDFGHFTEKFCGAMFGIGAGIDHPSIHNPDFDFPEEIIPNGVRMFTSIIEEITGLTAGE
jgi:amidohydrolase